LSFGRAALVPKVIGRPSAEAVALLERAGLRAVVTRRWD
jgi:beta-lactam-binding protein with PASTA domain